ncbi:EF-hand domain-containing protein [Roseibacillus ishigakijimensis]|uniref:EF-hand domain-containing protein n=1 Tax=Roseibacillus ishigakijimensis TaxID=454146 RepID=A0A934RNC9_9BACT|nr:EF-hand domain-containing protein [Roseibacillus ishigakijimensis]MBK1834982.1 EF-hand domain-containing protein [Roseibacillus ishigakijimensis]
MKTILLSTTLLALTAAASAEGDPRHKHHPQPDSPQKDFVHQFLSKYDTNQDGVLSQEEFAANPKLEKASPEQREALFNRIDKNDDGMLQPNELHPPKSHRRDRRPKWLERGPVDYDTFARQERVQKLPEEKRRALFERLDRNKDGLLSREDMPDHDRRAHGPDRKEIFRKMDQNEDGGLDFTEFFAAPLIKKLGEDAAEDRFEALDQDGDLSLSPPEFFAEWDKRSESRGEGKPPRDGDKKGRPPHQRDGERPDKKKES